MTDGGAGRRRQPHRQTHTHAHPHGASPNPNPSLLYPQVLISEEGTEMEERDEAGNLIAISAYGVGDGSHITLRIVVRGPACLRPRRPAGPTWREGCLPIGCEAGGALRPPQPANGTTAFACVDRAAAAPRRLLARPGVHSSLWPVPAAGDANRCRRQTTWTACVLWTRRWCPQPTQWACCRCAARAVACVAPRASAQHPTNHAHPRRANPPPRRPAPLPHPPP